MKISKPLLMICLSFLMLFTCLNVTATNDRRVIDFIKTIHLDDTIYTDIKIINVLPIGWGTMYKCELVYFFDDVLELTGHEFIMSVAVGSENPADKRDILNLENEEVYFVSFVKREKNTEPYLPAGTTGFEDKQGYLWELISITIAKDRP